MNPVSRKVYVKGVTLMIPGSENKVIPEGSHKIHDKLQEEATG